MQGFMVGLVWILLIVLAGGTVVFMFLYVLREKHEHTEHYIPDNYLVDTTGDKSPEEQA